MLEFWWICRVSVKVSWIWLLIWLLKNTSRAARQQTAYIYSMVTNFCSRQLKGKGKRFWAWEKCEECMRKEGVISTLTWWMFIMQKKKFSWQVFPSLLPSRFSCTKNPLSLPFQMPARLSDVIQSVYPFTLFNTYQAICIFWWLAVKI